MNLLEIKNLKKSFPVNGSFFSKDVGSVKAVNDVSLSIAKGKVLGLVGESGCGKSTLGRCILRLIEPDSGEVYYEGRDILGLTGREMKGKRRDMQIIFQDPYASLNPRMTVGDAIGEGLVVHKVAKGKEKREKILELLSLVGLRPDSIDKYPHEFSGGQRQRIGIARALALYPKFIVADEPVSALDVSIQAQIINLLERLKNELGLTYLFISHDLRIVEHLCDRVAVMYLGEIVEIADTSDIYSNPLHPYTRAVKEGEGDPDRRPAFPHVSAKRMSLPSTLHGCHGQMQDGGPSAKRGMRT
ncbi:MAG: Peptide transporter substrate-binding protein [Deltaproteobacteria bacterium]|nr:Peptide transporter substrate-binding protein [Deltaproteobacteria bacterium]